VAGVTVDGGGAAGVVDDSKGSGKRLGGVLQAQIEVVLQEGRHRQIRRMFAGQHIHVERLKRVSIGPVALGRLAVGDVRELSLSEVRQLRRAAVLPST